MLNNTEDINEMATIGTCVILSGWRKKELSNKDLISVIKRHISKSYYLDLSPKKSKSLIKSNTVCPGAPKAPKHVKRILM